MMGNNLKRSKEIFPRLHKRYQSDVDDVAVIYVCKMRIKHPNILQSIARFDKEPIKLMIKATEEGVSFPKERREINYLKAFLSSKNKNGGPPMHQFF